MSVKFFLERPEAAMPYNSGYQEDGFLISLAPFNLSEVEYLANECTEVRKELNMIKKQICQVSFTDSSMAHTDHREQGPAGAIGHV